MTTAELIATLQATANRQQKVFGPNDPVVVNLRAMLAGVKRLVANNAKLKKQLRAKKELIDAYLSP